MSKTRVLLVSGDGDFSVINFENAHGGTSIKDIMDNLDNYQSEDGEWNLEIREFDGDIDPKFVKFIKSKIQDYDESKNTTFFVESEILG